MLIKHDLTPGFYNLETSTWEITIWPAYTLSQVTTGEIRCMEIRSVKERSWWPKSSSILSGRGYWRTVDDGYSYATKHENYEMKKRKKISLYFRHAF